MPENVMRQSSCNPDPQCVEEGLSAVKNPLLVDFSDDLQRWLLCNNDFLCSEIKGVDTTQSQFLLHTFSCACYA